MIKLFHSVSKGMRVVDGDKQRILAVVREVNDASSVGRYNGDSGSHCLKERNAKRLRARG